MPDPIDLNPDGPHSPDHTAELSQLLDDCSRAITYATMSGKGGLEYPSEAYRLLGDLYATTGRLAEVCDHLGGFLDEQTVNQPLYDGQNRDPVHQVTLAKIRLADAAKNARHLTLNLQDAQRDINSLSVREDTE